MNVLIDGSFKEIASIHVLVGGVWKRANEPLVCISGIWRRLVVGIPDEGQAVVFGDSPGVVWGDTAVIWSRQSGN